jgi:hypothetical protein
LEALWPIVPSSRIVTAVYASGKTADVYSAITADDIRKLAAMVLKQHKDGTGEEIINEMKEAMMSKGHTVSAVIRYRVRDGFFASFEFIRSLLGEETIAALIEETAKTATN